MKTSLINIPSAKKHLSLTVTKPVLFSIPPAQPKPFLHPHIVEAIKMLYGKAPNELNQDEKEHFKGYQEYKIRSGLPIEED